ncbi:hypothetical protein B0H11DRAFT_1922449 [Mycena galericulata]|nr:hypothetical protein B0H11DRAFT_1922449 [Mycena galericulata]
MHGEEQAKNGRRHESRTEQIVSRDHGYKEIVPRPPDPVHALSSELSDGLNTMILQWPSHALSDWRVCRKAQKVASASASSSQKAFLVKCVKEPEKHGRIAANDHAPFHARLRRGIRSTYAVPLGPGPGTVD